MSLNSFIRIQKNRFFEFESPGEKNLRHLKTTVYKIMLHFIIAAIKPG